MTTIKNHVQYKNATKLGADLEYLMAKIFPSEKCKGASYDEIDADQISALFPMFGIDVGYPVTHSSILGDEDRPGYRVWVGVMRSNYPHYPDEIEDVDVCITASAYEAIKAAMDLILDDKIRGFFDMRQADDFIAETKLAEDYHANA